MSLRGKISAAGWGVYFALVLTLTFALTVTVVLADAAGGAVKASHGFVRVAASKTHFERDGQPYRFVGTNLWWGAMLGRADTHGDRPRLQRELDHLQSLGVTNLRVVALWEGPDSEPWRIVPALQPKAGQYDETALQGLDFLLAEAAARGMTVVLVLNDFWPWSGGMAQYLQWAGAGSIPYPPPHPGGDWGTYQAYTARFYGNARAVQLANAALRAVVTRVNTVTGVRYADDPAILAWQLANEPRGGSHTKEFNQWIRATARLIRSLDPRHLITTGSEGLTPWPKSAGNDVIENHSSPDISYVTAHIWAQNWGWYDPSRPETMQDAVSRMKSYLREHLELSRKLGKPLVVEEFGFPRDRGSHDPFATIVERDRYFREVFDAVIDAAKSGAPAAGVNFWAWAGEGLPSATGGHWQPGHTFTGDPPHEAQGWYGVYEHDLSTLELIRLAARRLSALP